MMLFSHDEQSRIFDYLNNSKRECRLSIQVKRILQMSVVVRIRSQSGHVLSLSAKKANCRSNVAMRANGVNNCVDPRNSGHSRVKHFLNSLCLVPCFVVSPGRQGPASSGRLITPSLGDTSLYHAILPSELRVGIRRDK